MEIKTTKEIIFQNVTRFEDYVKGSKDEKWVRVDDMIKELAPILDLPLDRNQIHFLIKKLYEELSEVSNAKND